MYANACVKVSLSTSFHDETPVKDKTATDAPVNQPLVRTQRIAAGDALLHRYFFTEPLPAHHSELPIPQRARRNTARHRPNFKEYDVDVPVEDSLLDPALINEFVGF